MRKNQQGFALLSLAVVLIALIVVIGVAWSLLRNRQDKGVSTKPDIPSTNNSETTETPKEPDSEDTLSTPETITPIEGKRSFVYGAPAGQNNKSPKKIIISLPGHGTSASTGYTAWSNHLDGTFALAELDWWDGEGENKEDYYAPTDIVALTHAFLTSEGYTNNDTIILHGFSRGSANTYAVIANDQLTPDPVFDAVISNAGKYQSDFPLGVAANDDAKITSLFKDMPWVLVCGGLDDNPDRDGCPGMTETKDWLTAHGANVLGLLTDPNQGHGAFHMSDLMLPAQALKLIDEAL